MVNRSDSKNTTEIFKDKKFRAAPKVQILKTRQLSSKKNYSTHVVSHLQSTYLSDRAATTAIYVAAAQKSRCHSRVSNTCSESSPNTSSRNHRAVVCERAQSTSRLCASFGSSTTRHYLYFQHHAPAIVTAPKYRVARMVGCVHVSMKKRG